jgi:septal ring factor EnvC (AmiA/AmiB activator)
MSRLHRSAALLFAAWLLPAAPAAADRQHDLEELRGAIEESRRRVGSYEREERGLLETVEILDRTAELLGREVAEARRAAGEARDRLIEIQAEAEEIARRLEATGRALKLRSVALYRAGDLGAVRLLFSSGGLREFLSRVNTLRRLLAHDAELLDRHRRDSAALELAESQTRESALRLDEAESQLSQRSAQLESERRAKRSVVAQLHANRARERSALVELERAARALEEILVHLETEPPPASAAAPGISFARLRRHLEPPVVAPIVGGFGRVVDSEFQTETFRSGVVFGAARGTLVLAVAAGRVRFAGWFRGYGKLVIVDHGEGYFSVFGHLDAISVEVGAPLARGAVLGTVGETGSLSGPQLYFEIRRGGEALDPRDWLRTRDTG